MIILQMIFVVLLIPATMLLLVLFNIYSTNAIYRCAVLVGLFIYACLAGVVLLSKSAMSWLFILLLILYFIRMRFLSKDEDKKNSEHICPSIYGNITTKSKFNMDFIFPLKFIRFVKLLPKALYVKINQQLGANIDLLQVINELINASIGTHIQISHEMASLNLIVK